MADINVIHSGAAASADAGSMGKKGVKGPEQTGKGPLDRAERIASVLNSEGGSGTEKAVNVLSNTISQMARNRNLGKSFEKSVERDIGKECDQLFKSEEDSEDVVKLSTASHIPGQKKSMAKARNSRFDRAGAQEATDVDGEEDSENAVRSNDSMLETGRKKLKQGREKLQRDTTQGQKETGSKKTTAQAKQYMGLFARSLASESPKIRQQLKQLEQELQKGGLSPKDLMDLQANVKKSVRGEIQSQIKDAFTKKQFTSAESKLDSAIADKGLNEILDHAFTSNKLGRWNFGGRHGSLQGTTNEAAREAASEIRDFIGEELKAKLTAKLALNKDVSAEMKDLMEVGAKSKFNFGAFQRNWQKQKHDEGLFVFESPEKPSLLEKEGGGNQQQQQQQQDQAPDYGFEMDPEKEVLMARVRALYMQMAIKGDFKTNIMASFKLRKLQNGMVQLGIHTPGLVKQLKAEAGEQAKKKMWDVLKEGLLERATLYLLKGPAYKLNQQKIKNALRTLKRMGFAVNPKRFVELRDDANRKMFDVTKKELQDVIISNKHNPSPELNKQKAILIRLMERLIIEAGIEEEIMDESIDDQASFKIMG
ncbi:hypothetical protein ACFL57_03090 [Candidatus Margulisiibacteriota bacterium]